MSTKLAYITVIFLLVVTGAAERWLRHERDTSKEIRSGVTQLMGIPKSIGQWDSEEFPLDSLVVEVAGCEAYRNLLATHRQTGQAINVAIMVGHPGAMSVHTPEVCWASNGYAQIRDSFRRVNLSELTGGKVDGQMIRVDFIEPRTEQTLRVYHGWFDGKEWSRPDHPRMTFFNRSHLFRMQVYAPLLPDPFSDEPGKTVDLGEQFLRDALPELTHRIQAQPVAAPGT